MVRQGKSLLFHNFHPSTSINVCISLSISSFLSNCLSLTLSFSPSLSIYLTIFLSETYRFWFEWDTVDYKSSIIPISYLFHSLSTFLSISPSHSLTVYLCMDQPIHLSIHFYLSLSLSLSISLCLSLPLSFSLSLSSNFHPLHLFIEPISYSVIQINVISFSGQSVMGGLKFTFFQNLKYHITFIVAWQCKMLACWACLI